VVVPLALRELLQLVALVQTMYILEGLTEWPRHLLVEVLVVPLVLTRPIRDELVSARLLNVIIEPGEVELVHAEADEVEEGLDVIDGRGVRVKLVLAHRREHRITLEVLDLAAPVDDLLRRLYALRQGEVNEVKVAILDADVVKFQVPVTVTDLV